MGKGFVSLAGAGPGDNKLITVKALEAIKKADVIIYDWLSDEKLLRHARAEAERIYVGKKSHDHTMKQEDINKLLVDKAKEGKYVVRLKGGDPFVFGRGGEEALELFENNVAFEIIPGITSAISVPAYAGIPVTQRNMATSFAVITGHEAEKEHSGIDWSKLATAVNTLVFLMGVEHLPQITKKLLDNGRDPMTPAAVIRWGTKNEQETLITTVKDALSDVEASGIKPPAIFIVGEVVGLRSKLAWFDNRPLFGKNILITRAREQASSLVDILNAKGANCIEAPVIKIMPPDDYGAADKAIGRLPEYDMLIFTSTNSVQAFITRMYENGKDCRSLGNARIVSIGKATSDKLKEYGLIADITADRSTAEGIMEAIAGLPVKGMEVLLPRAQRAREILPDWLKENGAQIDVVPVYQTVAGDADGIYLKDRFSEKAIDMVTFTSASTVANLLSLLGENGVKLLQSVKIACIGPITAKKCEESGIKPDFVSETATIAAFADDIEKFFLESERDV